MFIDSFTQAWFDELNRRAQAEPPVHPAYLLVDGAFVPGLYRLLGDSAKAILFELLPGCSEEARDVSPFLIPLTSFATEIGALLKRCSGWPMVSLIETCEPLEQLAARLASWCIVEADGQRFNFRFPDTRRLPAIFRALDETQRAQMAGPAVSWLYVARDGNWADLDVKGRDSGIADQPTLNQAQFALLVDDSRADEVLSQLVGRGDDPYRTPSRSHTLVTLALHVAEDAMLEAHATLDWCEWYWRNDELLEQADARVAFARWVQFCGER